MINQNNYSMKHLFQLSLYVLILLSFLSCGETSNANKEPNNSPKIKKKPSANVYKTFGRGINYKIVNFQQYYERGGDKSTKHLISIAKPSNGRELKKPLPLDMEEIRKFQQIETDKFEGDGPIVIGKEHQYKEKGQTEYWQFHKENTSKEVYLKEGAYSFIRTKDFEMLHIYDSVNDIEYQEMKMR